MAGVTIEIKGARGSGKTMFADMINKFLQSKDFNSCIVCSEYSTKKGINSEIKKRDAVIIDCEVNK